MQNGKKKVLALLLAGCCVLSACGTKTDDTKTAEKGNFVTGTVECKEVFQMERLLAGFSALGWREYLFAAGMAYVLTYIYRVFQRRKESGKNKEKTYVIQTFDKRAIDRCKELFPIDVLSFKGKEFKRGMQIRITTIQQNVIVGEFIGLNRVNLVCIKTGNKIIAHQLEKIAEVTKAE